MRGWGSELRVQGSGLGVQGSGFKVQGAGFPRLANPLSTAHHQDLGSRTSAALALRRALVSMRLPRSLAADLTQVSNMHSDSNPNGQIMIFTVQDYLLLALLQHSCSNFR